MRSKTANLNPLFEIKLNRFTQSFYPKDILSNIYNLIHVYDVAISYCSLVDPLVTPNEQWSSTQ